MANHTGNTNADVVYSYFEAYPHLSLAIIALVLFAIAGIIASAVTIRTRGHFMWIVTFFCCLEIAGYGCRISMLQSASYAGFVSMQVFLVVSPVFLALINYIVVGRLVRIANVSWLRHSLVAGLFFGSDILSLAIQGAGAGISTGSSGVNDSNSGKTILLIGLALQLVFFALFIALTVFIHANRAFGLNGIRQLRPVFAMLYITIILLLTRNIFRVVEFSGGWHSALSRQEGYFYVLDALLMLLAVAAYTILHPGFYMTRYGLKGELNGASAVLPVPARQRKDVEIGSSYQ